MTIGKWTEKYIYHKENGDYVVRVNGKSYGRYPTLEEATQIRDRALAGEPPPANGGRFAPGNAGQGRRAKGVPNKLTRDIKEGIIEGAMAHGSDGKGKDGLKGYFWYLAHRYPKPFTNLLGKLLPLQVNGAVGSYIGAVNIVQVPAGTYLTPDQVAAYYEQLVPPPQFFDTPLDDGRPNAEVITLRPNHD